MPPSASTTQESAASTRCSRKSRSPNSHARDDPAPSRRRRRQRARSNRRPPPNSPQLDLRPPNLRRRAPQRFANSARRRRKDGRGPRSMTLRNSSRRRSSTRTSTHFSPDLAALSLAECLVDVGLGRGRREGSGRRHEHNTKEAAHEASDTSNHQ